MIRNKQKKGMKRFLVGMFSLLLAVSLVPPMGSKAESAEPAAASAGRIELKSKNNVVPTYKAGEEKEWTFSLTNFTDEDLRNVVIQAELGDTADVWPFKTDMQEYRHEIESVAKNGGSADITFQFTQREDVPTTRYTIQFAIYADGQDKQVQKFYVNTTAKAKEETSGGKSNSSGQNTSSASQESDFAGGVSNGDAVYSGGGSSASGSVPRVIVTGFSTNPKEVRAGSDFTLTVHLKNTSKSSEVKNMLFDLHSPTEGKDEQTTAPAFLPASGSSSIYLESIGAEQTADISINLNAKSDLLQKPYSIDLAMKYEDSNSAQIEASSSLSVPVKQDARFELSEFEISPQEIEVGGEANVMCSLYNLGRIKLYNVKAVFEGNCIKKEEVFLGNVESGATASIDAMLEGKKETQGPAKITMTLSYEDESGKVSEKKEELQLTVTKAAETDEAMMSGPTKESGGFPMIPVLVIVGILAAVVVATIVIRKRKQMKMENEEGELLDELYGPSEDERE